MRIADVDTAPALKLCGVVRATYNSWLQNTDFKEIYRRRAELAAEYRQEAVKLLRRDNQLEAVLLEGTIVAKMKEELVSGEYSLIRSHLAREVYSKLISDLDVIPSTQPITFQQRIAQLNYNPPSQLPTGEVIDGEFIETDSEPKTELGESLPIKESQPTPDTTEEEV